MLHPSVLNPSALELLTRLSSTPCFNDLRLAGGTALALQLGHRHSVDLDFFGSIDFEQVDLSDAFVGYESVTVLKRSKNINIFVINQVKVDFVNYSYPWLAPPVLIENWRLASISDIAAMKLAAITGRGSRKDFVDCWFLLQQYSLQQLLSLYKQKYFDGSEYLVLKSLIWFKDADSDPPVFMPEGASWEGMKHDILQHVISLVSENAKH